MSSELVTYPKYVPVSIFLHAVLLLLTALGTKIYHGLSYIDTLSIYFLVLWHFDPTSNTLASQSAIATINFWYAKSPFFASLVVWMIASLGWAGEEVESWGPTTSEATDLDPDEREDGEEIFSPEYLKNC
jgi:hypothetical protein